MMRGDLEKYKSAYMKSVKEETFYSPFTPSKQFKSDSLVQIGKRNDIVDLNDVMGESKAWHT